MDGELIIQYAGLGGGRILGRGCNGTKMEGGGMIGAEALRPYWGGGVGRRGEWDDDGGARLAPLREGILNFIEVAISIVYNFTIMPRFLFFLAIVILVFCGLFFVSARVNAGIIPQQTASPTPARLAQPPTVLPPSQADNGAQLYWAMCMDCHGDRGQGLTDDWQNSFSANQRDCWNSGCHASDHPVNSFELPRAGAPALVGGGSLARFTNAFQLQDYIQKNMPLFPVGSISASEAWALTAFVLRLNNKQPGELVLSGTNSAAIPVHRNVVLPENDLPGVLILSFLLGLAAVGLVMQARLRPLTVQAAGRPNFFHHLHPPSIPMEQANLRYTLGAGGLAVFLSVILLVTGILEMFYYVPTPEQAAVSVQTISTLVPFGALIRNLHYWSAQFLVLVMVLHFLRVVVTGAYAPPRRFNYLLGLGLLVMILLLDFTGYVLRWDDGIRWALVVGANLLKTIPWWGSAIYRFVVGADEPGPMTLTRFYTWHTFGLALVMGIFTIWHVFRVRRDGGIAVPPVTKRSSLQRISRFELLNRELLMMIIAGAILLLISGLLPAPISQPISMGSELTIESRAPWFFLWVQWLLKLGDPFVWGVLTPVLLLFALGLTPYLLPNARGEQLGHWFSGGNRLAQVLVILIVVIILLLTVIGAFSG